MSNESALPAVELATKAKRRRRLIVFAVALVLAGIAYGAYWQVFSRYYESTDDAYVGGDLVQITSEISGTVISLNADDTQSVQVGQSLLKLDPADADVLMGSAEANLGREVRRVRTLFATADELKAKISSREIVLKRVQGDLKRRSGLAADGAVSTEELSHTHGEVAQMEAELSEARQQLNATLAQIDKTTVATHPQVLAAEAAVRDAELAQRRTDIKAPLAGVVARRSIQLGQRVAAGTPLMAVVPLDDVWVDANFKEVQVADMRVGQPVKLRADIYGRNAVYHGRLAGLAAGSGNAFALLPPQNASGNWIKIVQRLPVRIALDPQELKAHPLRVGLSMTVTVDVRDTSGPLVASQVRGQAIPTLQSLGHDPDVERRIERIVTSNDGERWVTASSIRRP
jgi:membrane fusion protein (multidrug efflux system)